MRLAIVSDTHVPGREAAIPPWVREELAGADHVVHAGDWDAPETVATVRDLADGLTGVRGNVDPPSVDLPPTATVILGGVEFVVTHGTGPHDGWGDRVAATVRDAASPDAVGVAGHTHDYTDAVVDGVRLLNPGSATGARPADGTTMMVAEAADGDLTVERRDAP
jgi:putative phosphoesterase